MRHEAVKGKRLFYESEGKTMRLFSLSGSVNRR